MSLLRDTQKSSDPAICGASAYLMVYNAVRQQIGLIHGRLHNSRGEHCAIGSFWSINGPRSLHDSFIDEIAAINDSAPRMTRKQRKRMVLQWLRWRLKELGVPGFERSKNS